MKHKHSGINLQLAAPPHTKGNKLVDAEEMDTFLAANNNAPLNPRNVCNEMRSETYAMLLEIGLSALAFGYLLPLGKAPNFPTILTWFTIHLFVFRS